MLMLRFHEIKYRDIHKINEIDKIALKKIKIKKYDDIGEYIDNIYPLGFGALERISKAKNIER